MIIEISKEFANELIDTLDQDGVEFTIVDNKRLDGGITDVIQIIVDIAGIGLPFLIDFLNKKSRKKLKIKIRYKGFEIENVHAENIQEVIQQFEKMKKND
ncbi:MAG: hypothetical protein R2792_15510 [Saprospiraceae bacterium]